MTTTSSEVKPNIHIPTRNECTFDTPLNYHLGSVRCSYGQYYAIGDSQRKAFRSLKLSLQELNRGMTFTEIN